MSQISTINLFLQSLYEELSPHQQRRLKQMSSEERRQAIKLIQAKNNLESIAKNPSQTSIDIILDYSRKTSELDAII